MSSLTLFQIIGLAGFVGYMTGFAAQQFRLIDGDGNTYSIVNIISAALVLISLMEQFNLASMMIQISWIIIGAIGVTLRVLRKKNVPQKAASFATT